MNQFEPIPPKNTVVQQKTNASDARPTLILGMIGFSPRQESDIDQCLAKRGQGAVGWRRGPVSQADAWCVNGARAQLLPDGSLRIGSAEAGGRSVRLALTDVSRPIAFSEPLASLDLEPAYSFSISEPASVCTVLDVMETRWLACTAVRRWLAGRLIAAEETLTQRIYHLVRGDRLLAVIDRTGDIGWLPGVAFEELEAADWEGRPGSAGFIPDSFRRTTISEVVWDFALRSTADLLPARYRSSRIYLRRPPKIEPSLIGDDHLLVMRELVVRPASFIELVQRTRMDSLRLAHALAALYITGSITTSKRRAGLAVRARSAATAALAAHPSLWCLPPEESGFGSHALAHAPDSTVPASLPTASSYAGAAVREEDGGDSLPHHQPA